MALEIMVKGRADCRVWAEITARYEVRRLGFDARLTNHPINVGEVAAAEAEADGAIEAILAGYR